MKLLTDVDGDEVSLVERAANRRRFLLLKGERGKLDTELSDILEIPWEREGSLLDAIRKDGVNDETVEKAVVAAVRLLKGVEIEFSPELVEKLGTELYGRVNPTLNTTSVSGLGLLSGSAGGAAMDGSGSGADKDGSGTDGELIGTGDAGEKVAADHPEGCDCAACMDATKADGNDSEDDADADDVQKRDFSADARRSAANSGQALPDGSFPIKNTSDLKNAIQAVGRAKDPGRAKAWIIRRAKALNATGSLPDSWAVSKSDDELDVNDDQEGGTVEFQVPVKKEDGGWDYSGVPEEARSFFSEQIEKADKMEKELAEARERLQKADDTMKHREALAKAASLSHVAPADDLAPILKEAGEKLDPESVEKLMALLDNAETRIAKGDLFTEHGSRAMSDGTDRSDAYSQLVAKADEMVEKSDKPLSKDQAFDRPLRANPELYSKYLAETGIGRTP